MSLELGSAHSCHRPCPIRHRRSHLLRHYAPSVSSGRCESDAARLRDPRTAWAAVGIGLPLVPNITHGNIGFTQFGYRYALDFQPLLFVVLATLFERGMSRLATAAAVASIAINACAVWAISTGFVAF